MKVIEEDGELSFADLEKVFTSIADPMIQMSMLQGLNDSLDNIKYTDNNTGQFVINAALNYLLQGVSNTLLGQIERSTEKNRTTTYVDKDSGVPVWMQRELGKLSQKIPGWDYQQTDYLDAWGQEQKNEGGLLYNLASPGYLSKEKAGQLNDELYRLHESTGKNVFPQSSEKTVTYTDTSGEKHMDYNLNEQKFAAMQKEEGQTAARLLSEIIQNKDYNKLTDAQRAAVVADVYEYAREQGRKAALPDYHSEANSWIRNAGTNPVNGIIQRAALSQINSSVTDSIGNVKNGWNVAEASRQEMDGFYDSFKSMSKAAQAEILESAIGDTAKYLEMRSNGLTTDEYLSVERRVKALGSTGVKDIQKYEAIANTPTLSAKDKDAAIMAYMTDYNPDAASPDTTELKYQYARQEMGLTPEQYIKALRANVGKAAERKAAWREIGFTNEEVNILYRLLGSNVKGKINTVEWYNSK